MSKFLGKSVSSRGSKVLKILFIFVLIFSIPFLVTNIYNNSRKKAVINEVASAYKLILAGTGIAIDNQNPNFYCQTPKWTEQCTAYIGTISDPQKSAAYFDEVLSIEQRLKDNGWTPSDSYVGAPQLSITLDSGKQSKSVNLSYYGPTRKGMFCEFDMTAYIVSNSPEQPGSETSANHKLSCGYSKNYFLF